MFLKNSLFGKFGAENGTGGCAAYAYDVNEVFSARPKPFKRIAATRVFWETSSGLLWSHHIGIRIEVYANQVGVGPAKVFYIDDGWIGGSDRVFFVKDIPGNYTNEAPSLMANREETPGP